jgi:hypothetical protein
MLGTDLTLQVTRIGLKNAGYTLSIPGNRYLLEWKL